ncbi:MAG: argininosuccinate synthase [Planctomycetes bacterium]|nr:argininosuccinate synthase [Planctomycetota bacterium]MBI3834530.1 argininosuccinate synthase [Planctomycetota bacterium]
MKSKTCVLAYSGGLDTSTIVVWLREQKFEVHAVLVDVGQDEDLESLKRKALRLGAATASICDAKPDLLRSVVPMAISFAATYEGNYRLGTALARPFIAAVQVRAARQLGGAMLVHGATGKGNDQIRFEFAYRSLAPSFPVLAPWKVWDLGGREDMIQYLKSRGFDDDYQVTKSFSFDENLFHLSVEGGPLEDASAEFDIECVLGAVADRFAVGPIGCSSISPINLTFGRGVPVAIDGIPMPLGDILKMLNQHYRFAPWAWDLVIENRFTGIKSRGLYINPAAKLLHVAVDALARTCLNKPTYDEYVQLGRAYGTILYRGEYFSDQREVMEASAGAIVRRLSGSVTVHPFPVPYVSRVQSDSALFRKSLATFENSDYAHGDANGFIKLSWLTSVGRPFVEDADGSIVETRYSAGPDVCADQCESSRRLVSVSA